MDLMKSIEKAQRQRQNRLRQIEGGKSQRPPRRDERPRDERPRDEIWKPPTYFQSKSVKIDPETLRKNRVLTDSSDLACIEAYKVLRAQILHRTREKGWRTIMVTSTNPMEGKSLTTLNLGITFAKELNQTVILVDADLRRQKMHQYLGIPSKSGLVDHLIYNRPLSKLIMWPRIEKLTLISGGRLIKDSSEHLGSDKMKHLAIEMKERYKDRYVFFDGPPLMAGADTIAFAPYVDCILMVVRSEKTRAGEIKEALELIPEEKIIGFVLNDHKHSIKEYYYY